MQLVVQFSNANAEPNVRGVETESHALTLSEDKKAQKLATNDSLELMAIQKVRAQNRAYLKTQSRTLKGSST
ncbi:hypothetical protein Tco_0723530 [Tanacetum coccineum]